MRWKKCLRSFRALYAGSPMVVSSTIFMKNRFYSEVIPVQSLQQPPVVPSDEIKEEGVQEEWKIMDQTVDRNQLISLIEKYSRHQPKPFTITDYINFGEKSTELDSAMYLRQSVPIRLAHVMKEFNILPINFANIPSVKIVFRWYIKSFREITSFIPPAKMKELKGQDLRQMLDKFNELIDSTLTKHQSAIPTMARALLEYKEKFNDPSEMYTIKYFLDRFFTARIGTRLIMFQHMNLFVWKPEVTISRRNEVDDEGYVGIFEKIANVQQITSKATEKAFRLCKDYYGEAPEVIIVTPNAISCASQNPSEITQEYMRMLRLIMPSNEDVPLTFTYPSSHLHYVLFELLKNSMRATVEASIKKTELFPLVIMIRKGEDDVTIKLSDHGGGIPSKDQSKIFNYGYTTAKIPQVPVDDGSVSSAPMAGKIMPYRANLNYGYGYGLPISRLFCRYFGGDLNILSMEGFGTDVWVHLKASSHKAQENIPLFDEKVVNTYEFLRKLDEKFFVVE